MVYLKAIIYGIIEGITEWLPISSTGHLLLVEKFLALNVSSAFMEMFRIVIQLGAILAVMQLHFNELCPWNKSNSVNERVDIFYRWKLTLLSVIPSSIVAIVLDSLCSKYLESSIVIAFALIAFGVIFLILEYYYKAEDSVCEIRSMNWQQALGVGLFQTLSIIPGTSRSGATMIGGMCLGLSRELSAKFSFYMAIPTMLGYSALKMVKYILSNSFPNLKEISLFLIAFLTAFIVSAFVVRWLTHFVSKHTFLPFAIYRILLGTVIIISSV